MEFNFDWDFYDDAAVLVIDEPFSFDNFVQPVCVDYASQFTTTSYNGYVRYSDYFIFGQFILKCISTKFTLFLTFIRLLDGETVNTKPPRL